MPASGTITSAGAATNSVAALCTAEINGKDLGPHSKVLKVRFQHGENSAYAHLYVPLAVLDDVAPSIAGVPGSPVAAIKQKNLAVVKGQLNPAAGASDPLVLLMNGVVTGIDPTFGPTKDDAMVTIEDYRYFLRGVQVIGSFWLGVDNVIYYRMNKAHFNPGNAPNCRYKGGIPYFCEPWYGITQTSVTIANSTGQTIKTTVPDPSTQPEKQATYWTPRAMLEYFRQACTAEGVGALAPSKFFPFFATGCIIPDIINWPVGLPSAFDLDNPAVPVAERKAPERIYHCHSLLSVLEDICKMEGRYAIDMTHGDGGVSTLAIVPTKYGGADINASPSGSSSKGVNVTRGNGFGQVNHAALRESSASFYSMAAAVGALAHIECRFDSALDTTASTLSWAYSDADRMAAKTAFKAALDSGMSDADALASLFQQYPKLFSDYVVNSTMDFQMGTTQEGFPLADVGRAPLPHQLTSFLQSGSDQFAKLNSRRPIPVEFSDKADDTNWKIMPQPDGIEILGDGTISFWSLRESYVNQGLLVSNLYNIVYTGSGSSHTITKFEPRRLRMNLAVPCDQRLTKAVRLACDPSDNVKAITIKGDDSDRVDPTYSQFFAADTGALHAFEERGGSFESFPIAECLKQVGGTYNNMPYPAADGSPNAIALYGDASVLRDDSAPAQDQSRRRIEQVGRLDRGGILGIPHVSLSYLAGMFIDEMENPTGGPFPIKACIMAIELNFEAPQKTEIHLE